MENEESLRSNFQSKFRKKPIPFSIGKELKEYSNKKLFRRAWLKMDPFKDWLMEGISADLAYCKVCEKEICAGKSELLLHCRGKKHSNLMKKYKSDKENNLDLKNTLPERIVDMRNDSLSQPSSSMKRIMVDSLNGDFSSMEKSVEDLEEFVTHLLDKDAGLLFPSHSMANLVAALAHCQARGSAVLIGNQSELYRCHERALVEFGGLHCIPFLNDEDGSFSLDEFERSVQSLDLNSPLTAFATYEDTFFSGGGRVLSTDWVRKLGLLCLSYGVHLHCDGTRLINASLHLRLPMCQLVTFCDSVTLALDKGLGSCAGAVLVGNEDFIKKATFIRDVMGGRIHQGAFLAEGGKCALDRFVPRIETDHRNARGIALAIVKENSPFIWVDVISVETNIMHVFTDGKVMNAEKLVDRLAMATEAEIEELSEVVIINGLVVDSNTILLMTHNSLSDHDVRMTMRKIVYIIDEIRQSVRKRPRKGSLKSS